MSDATPAGWYPDSTNGGRNRWWDGTNWTEHFQDSPARPAQPAYGEYSSPAAPSQQPAVATPPAYSTTAVAESLRAPEGIALYTPWIWLIVALPIIPLLALLTVDWAGMFDYDLNDPTSAVSSSLGIFASPGYLIALVGGWVVYGLNGFFAYRDFATLRDAGVPKPFHFGWVFLSYLVYAIGRSIVLSRRTGGLGKAPMWVAIGMIVANFLIVIIMMIMMFSGIADMLGTVDYIDS